VYNPANPNNLIAGQNDSRLGFNQCGIDWSIDDGAHWGDQLPPFRERINDPESLGPTPADPNSHTIVGGPGTFHTYDADSDPAPAFDSRGRGFFTCIAFDIFSNATLIYATQSPIEAQGSFFFTLDMSAGTSSSMRRTIPARPSTSRSSSPIPSNTAPIAITCTRRGPFFNFSCGPNANNYCSSTIFVSMSTDHGLTWSRRKRSAARPARSAFSAICSTLAQSERL